MSKLFVVGLSGKAGVGKDWHAARLVEEYGFHHMSFADQLKMQCIAEGLCTYEEAYITKKAAVRSLLQSRGTEDGWMKYGKDMWVRAALGGWCQLYADRYNTTRFVFSDVRFVHEVEGIEAYGGAVIRLIAPHRHSRLQFTHEQETHYSETALDAYPFSYQIDNDPGFETEARARINSIVSHHLVYDAIPASGSRSE